MKKLLLILLTFVFVLSPLEVLATDTKSNIPQDSITTIQEQPILSEKQLDNQVHPLEKESTYQTTNLAGQPRSSTPAFSAVTVSELKSREYSSTTSQYHPSFDISWNNIEQATSYTIQVENKQYAFKPSTYRMKDGRTLFKLSSDTDFPIDFKSANHKYFSLTDTPQNFNTKLIAHLQDGSEISHDLVLTFPVRKEYIVRIELNGQAISTDHLASGNVIEAGAPYEFKIYTSVPANPNNMNHVGIKEGWNNIKQSKQFFADHIVISPLEALKTDKQYTLFIAPYLLSQEGGAFVDSKVEYTFQPKQITYPPLEVTKVLINDDETKNMLTNPSYRLAGNDKSVSIYFNQQISLAGYQSAESWQNNQGIYLLEEGVSRYSSEARLLNESFETITLNDGTLATKATFTFAKEYTSEASLIENLASNKTYNLYIDQDIKNANNKSLANPLIIPLKTKNMDAKAWTLEIKDATFVTPQSGQTTMDIEAGSQVVIKANDKENFEFTQWSEPVSLKDDDPSLYQYIMSHRTDKQLSFMMPNVPFYLKAEFKEKAAQKQELAGFAWQAKRLVSGDDGLKYPSFVLQWETLANATKYTIQIEDKSYEFMPSPQNRNFSGNYTVFRTLYDSNFNSDFKKIGSNMVEYEEQPRIFKTTITAHLSDGNTLTHQVDLVLPIKAKIEKIEMNGAPLTNNMIAAMPYEIKIYTNYKANLDSAKNHAVIKNKGNAILQEYQAFDDYLLIKPQEALLTNSTYSLNITEFLETEDRSQSYLSAEDRTTINFKTAPQNLADLAIEKVLVNDDAQKDLLSNANYKLVTEDKTISIYFNQPIVTKDFVKSEVNSNSQGIYLVKKGQEAHRTDARLEDAHFELTEVNGKMVSKVTFSLVGKTAFVPENRLPLAANSQYELIVDQKIVNANNEALKNPFKLVLKTGEIAPKTYALSTKDAKIVTPAHNGTELQVAMGEKVVLEALAKEGHQFKAWNVSNYLKDDYPTFYQNIMLQKNNKRLEFEMPDTDVYLWVTYTKTANAAEDEKYVDYVMKHLVTPDLEVVEKVTLKDSDHKNIILINPKYIKVDSAETVHGLTINDKGHIIGQADIRDWKTDEIEREITIPLTLELTRAFLNLASGDPSDQQNHSQAKKIALQLNVTILKDSNSDGKADKYANSSSSQDIIIAKKKQLDMTQRIKTVFENKYYAGADSDKVFDLTSLGLELIASLDVYSLQLDELAHLMGVPNITDWKDNETKREFILPIEFKVKDQDIYFAYDLKMTMLRSDKNVANVIVSDVKANRIILFGYVEDNQPIFDAESVKWFDNIKEIEIYQNGKWQVLSKNQYVKDNTYKYIDFNALPKDEMLRIKVAGYDTLYLKTDDPAFHENEDGTLPPTALEIVMEYDLADKYKDPKTPQPQPHNPYLPILPILPHLPWWPDVTTILTPTPTADDKVVTPPATFKNTISTTPDKAGTKPVKTETTVPKVVNKDKEEVVSQKKEASSAKEIEVKEKITANEKTELADKQEQPAMTQTIVTTAVSSQDITLLWLAIGLLAILLVVSNIFWFIKHRS